MGENNIPTLVVPILRWREKVVLGVGAVEEIVECLLGRFAVERRLGDRPEELGAAGGQLLAGGTLVGASRRRLLGAEEMRLALVELGLFARLEELVRRRAQLRLVLGRRVLFEFGLVLGRRHAHHEQHPGHAALVLSGEQLWETATRVIYVTAADDASRCSELGRVIRRPPPQYLCVYI